MIGLSKLFVIKIFLFNSFCSFYVSGKFDALVRLYVIFPKGDNFCVLSAYPHKNLHSGKGAAVKGKNMLLNNRFFSFRADHS